MRLSKPNSSLPGALLGGVRRVAYEAFSIGREMVRIPAAIFMRVAERAGAVVLAGWLAVWPLLVRAWRALGRLEARAERELTPARGALAAAALTGLIVALSQFATYKQVTIGVPDYAAVAGVAPPPVVESADAGSAHLWLGIPLGLIALAIVHRAATGRWQAARLLAAVGLAVVVISLAVDLPKGLDEGGAAVAYSGAEASLMGGFWMQLVAGLALIALAPLLVRLLEPEARRRAAAGERRVQPIRLGSLRLPRRPRRGPRARRPRPRVGRATREAGG